jgi:glutamyl-tRNA reductase
MPFHLAGVSHHTADVSVRERLVFAPEEVAAWLARERKSGRSLVVLSTCNRLEW